MIYHKRIFTALPGMCFSYFGCLDHLETVTDLVICRISRHAGSAQGGEDVFLLCDKVNKGTCFTLPKNNELFKSSTEA